MKSDSETKWERTRAKGLLRYMLVFSLTQCGTLAIFLAAMTLVRTFVFAIERENELLPGLYFLGAMALISPLWAVVNWHLAEREHRRKANLYDAGGSTLGLGR